MNDCFSSHSFIYTSCSQVNLKNVNTCCACNYSNVYIYMGHVNKQYTNSDKSTLCTLDSDNSPFKTIFPFAIILCTVVSVFV